MKTKSFHAFHVLHGLKIKLVLVVLVPKLQAWEPGTRSSSFMRLGRKLELPRLHSQTGVWERAQNAVSNYHEEYEGHED